VAIAVALANNPVLLLADEPTGEVDTETAIGIYHILQDLNKQYGLTTIIVSHDVTIAQYVDRVVAIRDGKTSSETVRQQVVVEAEKGTQLPEKSFTFEEVILLDTAGRLQVPREYLEQFNIQGRVQLEAVDGGILIRPVSGETASQPMRDEVKEILTGPAQAEAHGMRAFWKRVRGSRRAAGRHSDE